MRQYCVNVKAICIKRVFVEAKHEEDAKAKAAAGYGDEEDEFLFEEYHHIGEWEVNLDED